MSMETRIFAEATTSTKIFRNLFSADSGMLWPYQNNRAILIFMFLEFQLFMNCPCMNRHGFLT